MMLEIYFCHPNKITVSTHIEYLFRLEVESRPNVIENVSDIVLINIH